MRKRRNSLVRANKADLCPANHDCPLEEMAFGNCEGDPECTQERAEKCWVDYWMGEGEEDS